MHRKLTIFSLCLLAALITAFVIFTMQRSQQQLQGAAFYPLKPASQIAEFELTDQRGQRQSNALFAGSWTIVNLGYSFCPDICPSNLIDLVKTKQHLTNLAPEIPLQMLFVTVDPSRDTPEVLASYINNFDPNIIALTGEKPQIDSISQSLNFAYFIESSDSPYYLVSHSDMVAVINPQGQLAGFFRPPYIPNNMAVVLERVIGQ